MIICVSSYSSTYKATDWTVVQNNIDIFEGATASADGASGLVPKPAKGDQDSKFLSANGSWSTVPNPSKLASARNISITGDMTGSTSFDGSADASIELVDNRFVIGTQTAATASWTGKLHGVKKLYDGLTIYYWLPYAGVSST